MHTALLRYGIGSIFLALPPSTAWSQVVSDGTCRSWAAVEQVATIDSDSMVELSGLQAGRIDPMVLWTHNDAGNPATIFALDRNGLSLGSLSVSGVENDDWEDLAIGPCMELYQQSCSCL